MFGHVETARIAHVLPAEALDERSLRYCNWSLVNVHFYVQWDVQKDNTIQIIIIIRTTIATPPTPHPDGPLTRAPSFSFFLPGASSCQPCPEKEWALPKSDACLKRTVLFLAWDAPLSIALLLLLAATLLLTTGSALVLLLHLNTPVVKSAGGRTCLVMLAALTAAAASALCHFGPPTRPGCLLKQPLFVVSFIVCLAAVTVRAFQVVCIFKLSSRLPRVYDTWAKNHGPEYTILLLSGTVLCISVVRVAADPPEPSADLRFYADSIVLECSGTLSPGSWVELACASLLSGLCFALSYMGKDLPANYNEAKCVAFSLVVYMISWVCYFTLYLISRNPFTMAVNVFAILSSVLGMLAGYFLPKVYIILFRPQMNTSAHFQNCIQMYTMNK